MTYNNKAINIIVISHPSQPGQKQVNKCKDFKNQWVAMIFPKKRISGFKQ